MAAVLSAPIEISSNEDLSERFVFQTDEGDPLSLNGYTATFGLRKASRGPTDLSATSADDEVIIDANAVVILIPSERLETLAPGSYSFEVKLTDPNGIRIVSHAVFDGSAGQFNLKGGDGGDGRLRGGKGASFYTGSPTSAPANSGAGGGGSNYSIGPSGAGGSGYVIVWWFE